MSEVQNGAVVITSKDMYDQLQKLALDMHYITTLLDPSLANLHKEIAEVKVMANKEIAEIKVTAKKDIDLANVVTSDHENRIRNMEKRIWTAVGMGLLAGFISPFIIKAFGG